MNWNMISILLWHNLFNGNYGLMDPRKKKNKASVRVVIIFLIGYKMILYFLFDFNCIKSQPEYKALIIGLEIILELRA